MIIDIIQKKDALRIVQQCIFFLFFTEVSHMVQVLHKVQPSLYLS